MPNENDNEKVINSPILFILIKINKLPITVEIPAIKESNKGIYISFI